MAKQTINIGTSANDGTGSTLREAFDITNDNFTELYDGTGGLLHKIEGTNFTGSLLIGHSTTGTLNDAQGNVGIGIGALDALTSADNNIAIGRNAGTALTSGVGNVAIGHEALFTEDTNGANVAIGFRALKNQNAGADAYNIAIGHSASKNITTGVANTIIGSFAGDALTTGGNNVAVGYQALSAEDAHGNNVAVGYQALQVLNAGNSGNNVAVGLNAGIAVSTGIKNTILGSKAGDLLETGENNIIIGYNAEASSTSVNNEITFGDSNISTVRIPSDSTLKIGASSDLQLEHVSSNSFIKNTAVGDLYIENQVDDANIIFRCDDGSGGLDTYFSIVGAGNRVQYNKNLRLIDNVQLSLGSSDDLKIYHNATDSIILNQTGDLYIANGTDDKDIIFQSDDGSGGLTTYFKLDGSTVTTVASKQFKFEDDVKLFFGTGADSALYASSDNLIIEQTTDDKDIKFMCDDGSGGTEVYINVDGSARATKLDRPTIYNDSITAKFGADGDMLVYHSGSTGYIENHTGHFQLIQQVDDHDIIFKSDDGSGGTTEYFRIDGSSEYNIFSKDLYLIDNVTLRIGTGQDLRIFHNGTNSFIEAYTGNLVIQNHTDDADIIFKSDDGSGGVTEYFKIDGQFEVNKFSKNVQFLDNVSAMFGAGADLTISSNGSSGLINNLQGNLTIQTSTDDGDIIFKSDDGSGGLTTYMTVDGSATKVTLQKDLRADDNVKIQVGSSGDLFMHHDGTDSKIENGTGHLYIRNNTDDKDIIFQSDDGSGGLSIYFRVDGSNERLQVDAPNGMLFSDNIKAKFGTGGDLQIYHDGSNSYIQDNGTGDLLVYFDNEFKVIKNGSSEVCIEATADGSVDLYHDSSKKFETTSSGALVTGDLEIANSSDGIILESPNGTRYRVTVDNSGNLSTAAL